jgi:acyl-CoA reductase-like NAD-dependent aldehyde dehydrogenase
LLLGIKSARLEYHPLGVIGIIIPWNYPFHNVVSAASAAIIAGNAALIKVSEWSTHSKILYEQLLRQTLAKRGHNPDLIQLIPGYGDTGDALVRSPGVAKVLFIGSPATGKKVMQAASQNLTPVILELGGKDPMIVFDDVSFDWAIAVVMRGCFINLGQNCISSERVYVHEKIFDKFAAALAEKVKSTQQGVALQKHCDFGSMTMPAQVDIVENLVNDAVKNGATVLAGGKRNPKHSQGNWYEPTVISNVKHNMRIVNEEVFGPVALLIKFRDEEELVEKVNSSIYGLGCSILSSNVSRAERLGRRIVSGMCTINDYGVSYLIQGLPFGGCKDSGFGRFNGPEGLRGFCREQSVVSDRFGIHAPVPRLILYPVNEIAPSIISAAIRALYLPSVGAKLGALWELIVLGVKNPKQFASTY